MYFGNIQGLYLLLFLIALIILYLIKAKPKDITIPSLLFFSADKKVKKYNAMLKKLLIRALFFLQLLFIALLALAAANPIIKIPIDAYSLNTVVIVDVSASMQTLDGRISRMDSGKQELLKLIKGKTSIVLAENNPVIMVRNVSSSRAKALISNLDAKDISTRLDSSIMLANDLLGGERGTVVVYSDFILGMNDDILAAKKIAEANDKRVVFLPTGERQENLGFSVLNINRGKGEVFVKNFGKRGKAVDVRLISGTNKQESRIQIEPYSVEKVSFDIKRGDTILELTQKDRLTVDDKIYVVNPYERESNILFITNHKGDDPLLDALEANPQFNIQIARPPVIPDLNHDVVVIGKVDKVQLLPNTFRDIKKYKDKGGKVIIASHEGIESLDFQDLIGFKFGSLNKKKAEICVDIVNDFTAEISNPRCFTSVLRYNSVEAIRNSTVVVASTKWGKPIFIMENNLFYYGILDSYSGFQEQINYPLFWSDLINYMLGRESLANFNFKTGDISLFGGNRTDRVVLDKAGIFDINGRRVAVNLLNDAESDIFRDSSIMNKTEFKGDYEKVKLEVNLDQYLLLLAIILFLYELYYIKRRGDL